jgi:hypothetical protein
MQLPTDGSTTVKDQCMRGEAPTILRVTKTPSMRLLFVLVFFLAASPAIAFEADVHYGLTNWLALQAGFEPEQAQIIATFDQRTDSGDMPFIDVVGLYACLAKDEVSARRAGEHHYPSEGSIPGPPETRAVVPNSRAARKAALEAIAISPNQAQYRFSKLGEALHILQDSWANQGIPTLPQLGEAASTCDSGFAWGHSEVRGGPASHRADLTVYWPMDTVAMAEATYEILQQYPPVSDTRRTARSWQEIRQELDDFISASTKTEKARWFVAHGINDVSFLEGISLPDGAEAFLKHWPNRKLPSLRSEKSSQHAVEPTLLDFYNSFFESWLATKDFTALVTEFSGAAETNEGTAATVMSMTNLELESRLKLWRLIDHGRVAELGLRREPLTREERANIDEIANRPGAYVSYAPLSSAYFPLLPGGGHDISPLLPFFIAEITSTAGHPRAMAVTKFRHAPYDIVGVVAESINGRWRVTSVVSTVDH